MREAADVRAPSPENLGYLTGKDAGEMSGLRGRQKLPSSWPPAPPGGISYRTDIRRSGRGGKLPSPGSAWVMHYLPSLWNWCKA